MNALIRFCPVVLAAACFTKIDGATPASRFGFSIVGLGTLDNDNFADYAAGAPRDNSGGNGAGAVFAYLGSADALQINPGAPHFVGLGVDGGEQAGFSLAAADFDGDGNVDLAIGAPTKPDVSGAVTGAVYLVSGEHVRSGGVFSLTDAECVIQGVAVNDNFGWSVATGDVNGDGFADLVVGAPGVDSQRGEIDAFYGDPDVFAQCPTVATADFTYASPAKGRLGHSVLVADSDGDGMGDLFAGAPYRGGSRGYVLGLTSGGNALQWTGAGLGDRAGWSLTSLDLDSDSFADIAIGAPLADRVQNGQVVPDAGAAFIDRGAGMTGGSLASNAVVDGVALGATGGDRFGWSVARMGKFSPSYDENLLVGAPLADYGAANSGSVYVLSRTELLAMPVPGVVMNAQARVDGSLAGGSFGYSLAGIDDADGSGVDDAATGAPFTPNGSLMLGAL